MKLGKTKPFLIKIQIVLVLALTLFLFCISSYAQDKEIQVGAYYFDGWGKVSTHVTKSLRDEYPEREPKWGWVTSTQEVVDEQIQLASQSGLSFFSFCWYMNHSRSLAESNQIISTFLNSSRRGDFKFCLLVANHAGFEIGPNDWEKVTTEWLKMFREKTYLTFDQKPLLIFFTVDSLVKQFGGVEKVKAAFDTFKKQAIENGFKGVSIFSCVPPKPGDIKKALSCGFDGLTGYNYHGLGFPSDPKAPQAVPLEQMTKAEQNAWDKISESSGMPYLPVSTLNWDPRPWATPKNQYAVKPYYTGYSSESVERSVREMAAWLIKHENLNRDRIGILYAWNEYGEGAWLTPSRTNDLRLLDGVRKAMQNR